MRRGGGGGLSGDSPGVLQTRDVELMLVLGWPSVADAGPTLNQHWFNVSRRIHNGTLLYYSHMDLSVHGALRYHSRSQIRPGNVCWRILVLRPGSVVGLCL